MSSSPIGCSTCCRRPAPTSTSIADHFKLDRAKLLIDVERAIDGAAPRTRPRCPSISDTVIDALDRGWHYATLFFGETQIRTGHVLVGALKTDRAARARCSPSRANSARSPSMRCSTSTRRFWAGSDEENLRPMDGSGLRAGDAGAAAAGETRRADRARPLLAGPDRARRAPARWTRSSAATRRSARSSTC